MRAIEVCESDILLSRCCYERGGERQVRRGTREELNDPHGPDTMSLDGLHAKHAQPEDITGPEGLGHSHLVAKAGMVNVAPEQIRGISHRSEERRVGKECRSRWSPYH